MADRYKIHVHRSIGNVSVAIDVPPEQRDEAVAHVEQLLRFIPEVTLTGADGVVISSIPNFPPSETQS